MLQEGIPGNGQPITVTYPLAANKRFYQVSYTGAANTTPIPLPDMVWIAPGTFTMGSPMGEKDRHDDEGPQTKVTISQGFWMGKYEVTQESYLAVMNDNPSAFIGNFNRPVEQVSWLWIGRRLWDWRSASLSRVTSCFFCRQIGKKSPRK